MVLRSYSLIRITALQFSLLFPSIDKNVNTVYIQIIFPIYAYAQWKKKFPGIYHHEEWKTGKWNKWNLQYNILLSDMHRGCYQRLKKNSGRDRTAKLRESNTALPDTILSRGPGSEEMSEIARLGCGRGEVVSHTTLSHVQDESGQQSHTLRHGVPTSKWTGELLTLEGV